MATTLNLKQIIINLESNKIQAFKNGKNVFETDIFSFYKFDFYKRDLLQAGFFERHFKGVFEEIEQIDYIKTYNTLKSLRVADFDIDYFDFDSKVKIQNEFSHYEFMNDVVSFEDQMYKVGNFKFASREVKNMQIKFSFNNVRNPHYGGLMVEVSNELKKEFFYNVKTKEDIQSLFKNFVIFTNGKGTKKRSL